MTHIEIVNKLIGPTRPMGESHEDEKRLDNLKEKCDLVAELLQEIKEAASYNRPEYSIKRIADYAKSFLQTEVSEFSSQTTQS